MPAALGLALGLAGAYAVADGLGARFEGRALLVLDPNAASDLTVDAQLAAPAAFGARIAADLDPEHREAAALENPIDTVGRGLARLGDGLVQRLAERSIANPPTPAERRSDVDLEPSIALSLALAPDARSVTFDAIARTAEAARTVATAAAETMLHDRVERRRTAIAAELAATETAIGEARAAIDDAAARLATASPEALANATRALAAIDARHEAAAARALVLRADLRALRSAARPPLDRSRLLAQPRSKALARAIAARDRAQAHITALAETYGERHPVMVAATTDLERAEAAVERAVAVLLDAVAEDLETAEALAGELGRERATWAEAVATRQADRDRFAAIDIKLAEDRARLNGLRRTRFELVAASSTPAADARVIARPETTPAAPPIAPALLYGGGGALGFLVGGSLGGLLAGGRRVRRDDGQNALGKVLVLASLPALPRGGRATPDGREAASRLALRLEGARQPERLLALTSLPNGPSASAVALALGVALAAERRAVLVIDTTGDRHAWPRRLRTSALPTLSDVLLGEARWSEALLPFSAEGPWLLAARTPPPRDLPPGAMQHVLDEATRRFDRVLIALPPVPGAGTLRTAKLCGATLLLLRAERTRERDALAALDELEAVGARAGGVVLVG